MEKPYKIIAVDFDGTLCENAWPEIGAEKKAVIDYVLNQKQKGAKIILWTNRNGRQLGKAIKWCMTHGIVPDAVNENIPEMIEYFGNDCRKVFADEYIDDRAIPVPGDEKALTTELGRELYNIREQIGKCELLAQLAEESAELAKAALKYRRALDGSNPTPVSAKDALDNLIEEIADVETCFLLLEAPEDAEKKTDIMRYKIFRWAIRLEDRITQIGEAPSA